MSIELPQAPEAYDRDNEGQARNRMAEALDATFKRGEDVNLEAGERLILKDRVTADTYAVVVDSGVLSLELVT